MLLAMPPKAHSKDVTACGCCATCVTDSMTSKLTARVPVAYCQAAFRQHLHATTLHPLELHSMTEARAGVRIVHLDIPTHYIYFGHCQKCSYIFGLYQEYFPCDACLLCSVCTPVSGSVHLYLGALNRL